MAVKTRKDYFGLDIGVDPSQIVAASRLVAQTTGFVVQPNKAVVGANAFAHASGIHQDGVFKARETYEIMTAEDVGWATNKIVLGKLSGRNAFKQRLKELGIELDAEEAYNKAFQRFKDLADKKADIFDEDLQALVTQEAGRSGEEDWKLVTMNQASGMGERPHAAVVLLPWLIDSNPHSSSPELPASCATSASRSSSKMSAFLSASSLKRTKALL